MHIIASKAGIHEIFILGLVLNMNKSGAVVKIPIALPAHQTGISSTI